jgi:hypothetical protein
MSDSVNPYRSYNRFASTEMACTTITRIPMMLAAYRARSTLSRNNPAPSLGL